METDKFMLLGLLFCLSSLKGCHAQQTTNAMLNAKVLEAGRELRGEILPLNMGQTLYEIDGSKKSTRYEIKISYPASIPASFSIDILNDDSTKAHNFGRRLLNTEKLVFNSNMDNKIFACVNVKTAGIVAVPYSRGPEFVIFNIVCDELIYGLPIQVWWVGFLALLGVSVSCLLSLFITFNSEFFVGKSDVDILKQRQ